jgi:hypothetical protein
MRRGLILLLCATIGVAVAVATFNYVSVYRDMLEATKEDPRNQGLVFYAYHQYLISPGTIVIDFRDASGTNSQADIFRLMLMFAAKQKRKSHESVVLAYRGTPRFLMKGVYFKTLGDEYGVQNPVYTMRTLPENILNLDGTAAFPSWTGGMLGVLGKQMEDFGHFHKGWYLNDLAKERAEK